MYVKVKTFVVLKQYVTHKLNYSGCKIFSILIPSDHSPRNHGWFSASSNNSIITLVSPISAVDSTTGAASSVLTTSVPDSTVSGATFIVVVVVSSMVVATVSTTTASFASDAGVGGDDCNFVSSYRALRVAVNWIEVPVWYNLVISDTSSCTWTCPSLPEIDCNP